MINKEKVELMTKMASYEQNQGKEDLKISAYYRKDYVSIHVIYAIIGATIAYGLLVLLGAVCFIDFFTQGLSMSKVIVVGTMLLIGYAAFVVAYAVVTYIVYDYRFRKARARVKRYNYRLIDLLKMYKKEKFQQWN